MSTYKSRLGKKEKTAGQKFKSFLNKTLIAGALVSPLIYVYGTRSTTTARVLAAENGVIYTDNGVFRNVRSFIGAKFKTDVRATELMAEAGKTYAIESYGLIGKHQLPFLKPNILSLVETAPVEKSFGLKETFTKVVDGYVVELTTPKAVADSVVINSITPLAKKDTAQAVTLKTDSL